MTSPTSTDLGTTKRKALTPTQRLKLFEAHKGICVICGLKIQFGEGFVDEHIRALGLAGSNDLGNRGPAHIACAEVKTRQEDMPRINKAKSQKMASLGIKPAPKRPIESAGFPPPPKKRERKPSLEPRRLYA